MIGGRAGVWLSAGSWATRVAIIWGIFTFNGQDLNRHLLPQAWYHQTYYPDHIWNCCRPDDNCLIWQGIFIFTKTLFISNTCPLGIHYRSLMGPFLSGWLKNFWKFRLSSRPLGSPTTRMTPVKKSWKGSPTPFSWLSAQDSRIIYSCFAVQSITSSDNIL